MIIGIGIDLVEIERIKAIYQRHGPRFLNRILTPAEQSYVLQHKDPSGRLSGRWAAKEAGLKALGTGLAEGILWREVEVLPDERGKPTLTLHGKAAARAAELGGNRLHVTITHCDTLAMAQVILERI
ncbi:MAG TPA: holo-ACP synthase [Planctomycetota bacterium]|nr:holo-ACP synthase [Planctomycetota bacterium]